ncbi:ABC transporter ATP-binding protein [Halomontanus rarus]|uniref:ABC transporter ATP-binding protein n=1 Tax=Halomontanus rarus TaxID=3034020 RepID=UPI0023E7DE0D|nr:ABC transporter ATP-binding protein [Halovivax sp. TS33]
MTEVDDLSWQQKGQALISVARFKPLLTISLIIFSFLTALLEGIGLTFLIPIIELVQSPTTAADSSNQLVQGFVLLYDGLGVPFSLGYVTFGVTIVMTTRYVASFIVSWLSVALQTYYKRELQTTTFENTLNAHIAYFDKEGSDDILNAIVTQAEYAAESIHAFVKVFQQLLLCGMYLIIAFILSPTLTLFTVVALGGFTFIIRNVLESGYAVGDRVADANETVQQSAQAGTQGIRDVKLYTMEQEIFDQFTKAVDKFTSARIKLGRNEAAIDNFYNLSAAVTVFILIYLALRFAGMSLASLGVFLFAMFQLAPQVSALNNTWYKLEGHLPHLIRTQNFVERLKKNTEGNPTSEPIPSSVEKIAYDDVSFSYDKENHVLDGISFRAQRGEFIAFVGQSGAGKSTIIKLLAQMYEPDQGRITANESPIDEMNVHEWRKRIAVVRQDPYIFNETLINNITIGDRGASKTQVRQVCEIAHITEFLNELPDGLDTVLGDNGVRLSGGQRQRVSLARALLKDSDILVLDEATSDLDTNIERDVQQAIESMDHDYVIIAIAHRLSTIVNADYIYTLEHGEITEQGTHEELLNKNGKYNELYSVQ